MNPQCQLGSSCGSARSVLELIPELIHAYMTPKVLLWDEVGAYAMHNRPKNRWRGPDTRFTWGLCGCVLPLRPLKLLGAAGFLVRCPSAGVCEKHS
jgi:hypothetical protein